ncbi:MAG: ATP-binding protein [Gemmataceae bacterium]
MKTISRDQVIDRIKFENPWWKPPHQIDAYYQAMQPRAYFGQFYGLTIEKMPRRALILMGPRRVGKTVLIYHAIQRLIKKGADPRSLWYVTVESPIYNGLGLEELLNLASEASGIALDQEVYFFVDEIQYLREWEVHLKTLVDAYPRVKVVASGSAAAALRLKSNESGAGRFTDFLLPPLTFHEYLKLLKKSDLATVVKDNSSDFMMTSRDIGALNEAFLHYLNFGGYPEVIFSKQIQSDPGRYIRNDIIDKVLLRDLPSLYGIKDIQELNTLFTTLAYNTGDEVSLDGLSQNSGLAKNTLKRYIDYLEAAFLIKIVHRIDRTAKRFRRATHFKVYLTNPSMRSALFSPLGPDDPAMGNLVETAVFAQWFHSQNASLHYSRWNERNIEGEVDIVYIDERMKPMWAVEVKWSDEYASDWTKLASLRRFLSSHKLTTASVTTRTVSSVTRIDGAEVEFIPAALYCYLLGYNIIRAKSATAAAKRGARIRNEGIGKDDPVPQMAD